MKSCAAWTLIIWMSIVAENTRQDLFPSCTLVVPTAIACLFWSLNSIGVVIAGTGLTLRWMLQPEGVPAETFAVLLVVVAMISRNASSAQRLAGQPRKAIHWLHPGLAMAVGLIAHLATLSGEPIAQLLQYFLDRTLIALPLLAAFLVIQRAADELGLRRPAQSVI